MSMFKRTVDLMNINVINRMAMEGEEAIKMKINTAALTKIKGKLTMLINLDFYRNLSNEDKQAVIAHEVGHYLQGDMIEGIEEYYLDSLDTDEKVKNFINHDLFNVIFDHSINMTVRDEYGDVLKEGVHLRNSANIDLPTENGQCLQYIVDIVEPLINGWKKGDDPIIDTGIFLFHDSEKTLKINMEGKSGGKGKGKPKKGGQPGKGEGGTPVPEIDEEDKKKITPPKKGEGECNSKGEEDKKEGKGKGQSKPKSIEELKSELEQLGEEVKKLEDMANNMEELSRMIGNGTGEELAKVVVENPVAMSVEEEIKTAFVGELDSNRWITDVRKPNYGNPYYFGESRLPKTEVNVIVDVSGSMSDVLPRLADILYGMNLQMRVIQVDTQVKESDIVMTSPEELENHDFLLNWGGGTELFPAFEYLYQMQLDNKPTFVITDGELWGEDAKNSFDMIPDALWFIFNNKSHSLGNISGLRYQNIDLRNQ